ncbi:MAG: signal peptidase I [bacterium]
MRQLTRENLTGTKFEQLLIRMFGMTGAAVTLYFVELAEVIVISLAIILPIRYFLIQPFYVKGASMEPNFQDHEYLIIDELSYRFRAPVRGEVIVFRYPIDPTQYFIKRVIGLPGETIKVENGRIWVVNAENPNGFELSESYLQGVETPRPGNWTLTVDQYFIMGDNRPNSLDSRFFGPIDKNAIVGRVWVRGWPIPRATIFGAPTYQVSQNTQSN